MRNVSDEGCREYQNSHFMFNKFFPENRAIYKVIIIIIMSLVTGLFFPVILLIQQ